MQDPNDETIKTYRENFSKYAAKTTVVPSNEFKAWIDKYIALLPANGTILEFGSATGRDARYFRSKGLTVTCTDVVPEVLHTLRKDSFETTLFDFREAPKLEWIGAFDGLFANAVLLHAPEEVFKKVLHTIGRIVKKNGIVAFSLKTGEGEAITLEKMGAPRYFKYHTEGGVRKLLSEYPYEILSIDHTEDHKWLQVILRNRTK